MKPIDFSENPIMARVTQFAKAINSQVAEIHGRRNSFKLDAPKGDNLYFTTRNSKGEQIQVRLNAVVPSEELFTVAQELVRAADEPFASREVFPEDTGFHPGSREIAYDVLTDQGEAEAVAIGPVTPAVTQADVVIGRKFQPTCKIPQTVTVTRDDMQLLDMRQDRRLSPLVDLMNEKLLTGKKNIERTHDRLIWQGAEIRGAAAGRILGFADFMSTNSANYNGNAPTAGKMESVPTVGGLTTWFQKTSELIIADIARGIAWVQRNNAYNPNTIVLPPSVATNALSFKKTSTVDSTPLIEWIQRAAKLALGKELKTVISNAMQKGTVSGTTRPMTWLAETGFLLLEADKRYGCIATVEPLTMLAPVTLIDGSIQQMLQIKTAGYQGKHPGMAYVGTGIQLGNNIS